MSVAVVGPRGWRWQRSVEVSIGGGRGPLAVPVLSERITLDGGPGTYRCAASLGTAAAAAGGRATVEVVEHPASLNLPRSAVALGFAEPALGWLASHGLDIVGGTERRSDADLLLVGHAAAVTQPDWRDVGAAVDRGATAVVLCPWELIPSGETSATLPIAPEISCASFHDWLYHKECFARRADIVEGLPGPGLMDWRHYGPVLPRHMVHGDADDVAAFAVAVGFPCRGGYASGLLAARFLHERGRVVVSTLDLLAHLGSLAVADRLMANLIRYATNDTGIGAATPRRTTSPAHS